MNQHLNRAVPRNDLASTGFCLADPGRAYAAYGPMDQTISMTLDGPAHYRVRWIDVRTGAEHEARLLEVAKECRLALVSPTGADAVVVLVNQDAG